MAHILARFSDVKFEDIKRKLKEDAAEHAQQGMYLEQLWRNVDDANEVLFLFRVDDLNHCKQLVITRHAQARRADPNAKLPQMTFLDGA